MATENRPPSWLELAAFNVGLRRAGTAASWAYCWAFTREAIGHDPSVEEVAEWWKMTRRTAFRDQATFREAFPWIEIPAAIYNRPESRERLARHAAIGDRFDRWKKERKDRRNVDSVPAMLSDATGFAAS